MFADSTPAPMVFARRVVQPALKEDELLNTKTFETNMQMVGASAEVEAVGRYPVVGRYSALRTDVNVPVDEGDRSLSRKLLRKLVRVLHHRAD